MAVGNEFGFCASTANVWYMAGILLLVVKIVIPILLIVVGILYLGKAVVAKEDKEIKQNIQSLIKRIIVGIVIFFIPQIITGAFGLVRGFNRVEDDYTVCSRCITNPRGVYCLEMVERVDLDA